MTDQAWGGVRTGRRALHHGIVRFTGASHGILRAAFCNGVSIKDYYPDPLVRIIDMAHANPISELVADKNLKQQDAGDEAQDQAKV